MLLKNGRISLSLRLTAVMFALMHWSLIGGENSHKYAQTVQSVVAEKGSERMVTVRGKYLPDGPRAWIHDAELNFCEDSLLIYVCMIDLVVEKNATLGPNGRFSFSGWPSKNTLVPVGQREKAKLSKDWAHNLPDCIVVTGLYKEEISHGGLEQFFGTDAEHFPSDRERRERIRRERYRKGIIVLKQVHLLGKCK